MAGRDIPAPGFYGKLPARGDFVSRRLGGPFVAAFDGWLQEAIEESRDLLKERWLDRFLVSPVWRFAAQRGVFGPFASAGVMGPSVDSAGRYFPLAFAREFDVDLDVAAFIQSAAAWHATLETRAVEAVSFTFDLVALDAPDEAPEVAQRALTDTKEGAWCRVPIADALSVLVAVPAERLRAARMSFWWTNGSDDVDACVTSGAGPPPGTVMASMFDGSWPRIEN